MVKEQEDISANLSDPLFANDEYQRISLTLSEYTFNIEKIAAQLFDIAKKTRVVTDEDKARIETENEAYTTYAGVEEVQAMTATKTLIEMHKALVVNEPRQAICENASVSSVDNDKKIDQPKKFKVEKENETDRAEFDCCKDLADNENQNTKTVALDQSQKVVAIHADEDSVSGCNDEAKILEVTRDRLSHLGPTVMALIEKLIIKYSLPHDILSTIAERLSNANNEENGETESRDTEDCIEDKKDNANCEQEPGNTDEKDKANENNGADDDGSENEDEESQTIFNISTETIRDEVFAALKHKLRLSFDETERVPRKLLDQDDAISPDTSFLLVDENEREKLANDHLKATDEREPTVAESNSSPKGTSHTGGKESEETSNENGDESDGVTYMVSFYSLSTEFIKELQRRKSEALSERKSKALANIHDKIERLKKEMERVEETVSEELSLAYKRKMEKVEKQKKHLDERHSQVKEAERLLEYYTMTGQQDKVAELVERFNLQNEDN